MTTSADPGFGLGWGATFWCPLPHLVERKLARLYCGMVPNSPNLTLYAIPCQRGKRVAEKGRQAGGDSIYRAADKTHNVKDRSYIQGDEMRKAHFECCFLSLLSRNVVCGETLYTSRKQAGNQFKRLFPIQWKKLLPPPTTLQDKQQELSVCSLYRPFFSCTMRYKRGAIKWMRMVIYVQECGWVNIVVTR